MTLYWFLLVVSTLALAGFTNAEVQAGPAVLASVLLVLGWSLLMQLAGTTARLMIRQGHELTDVVMSFERQLDWLRWGGLVISGFCLIGFRLAIVVKELPYVAHSMALQAMLMGLPAWLITMAAWISEHRLGVTLGLVPASKSIRAKLGLVRECFQAMLESGGWILLPVLTILTATDVLGRFSWFNQAASAGLLSAAALIGVPMVLPMVMCRVWKTREPAEDEQTQIDQAIPKAIQRRLKIRVWDTGMRSSNALIAGFLPRMQTMLLTDRLLNSLSTDELSLVVAHEVAHLRRGHIWMRAGSLVPVWILAAWLTQHFAAWPGSDLVINLFAILMTGLTLRWVAHLTELDADRSACAQISRLQSLNPNGLTPRQIAELYGLTLNRITNEQGGTGKASWLHPSVQVRCQRITDWAHSVHRGHNRVYADLSTDSASPAIPVASGFETASQMA